VGTSRAAPHQPDGLAGRVVAVVGVDDFVSADVELARVGNVPDIRLRPDEYGLNDTLLRGMDDGRQGGLVARMRHCSLDDIDLSGRLDR
jgi:hypothetical protein